MKLKTWLLAPTIIAPPSVLIAYSGIPIFQAVGDDEFGFKTSTNFTGNIYASRNANVDNLIALGYQPKYVNKTFDGTTVSSYLKEHINLDKTEKINQKNPWSAEVDLETIVAKKIKTAFIAGFQSGLYENLRQSGIAKENIGFTSMGETYIPDMYWRTSGSGDNMKDRRNAWNASEYRSKYGDARPTSIEFSAGDKEYLWEEGDTEVKKGNDFSYTSDVCQSLLTTAESIDRITSTTTATTRARTIIAAFNTRIQDIYQKANIQNKTALILRPERDPGKIGEIIPEKFAWDPTVAPFIYSEKLGVGYDFPRVKKGHLGKIEWLEDDVNGLKIHNNLNGVRSAFNSQVDTVFFLRPSRWLGVKYTNEEIQQELKSLTKNNDINSVKVVDEDLYFHSNFGIIGYFKLMDDFANMMRINGFLTGEQNWGWNLTDKDNLKLSL